MSTPKVIDCDAHGLSPWSVVCVHLMDGESTDWRPIEVDDGREVESDWTCPECEAAHRSGRDDVSKLLPVCMHCARTAREG